MSFHWISIVFGIVINIVNVESQCQGKGYTKFEEVNGHCFFEPPDADYRNKINTETAGVDGPKNFLFNMTNAKKVCEKHGAEVLQWDTTIEGNETDAIKRLRAKLDGNVSIPVPCAGKGVDKKIDCYSGVNKTAEGFEIWYFINSQTGNTVPALGGYYRKEWDGLICHHLPGEGSRPTMAAFMPFLAMLIAVVNP